MAFSVILTAAMSAVNMTEVESPEQLDDALKEVIEDFGHYYDNDKEKAELIFNALDDYFYTTVISQNTCNTAIDMCIGVDDPIIKVTAGLLQAAAHVNIVNEHSDSDAIRKQLLNKRNFLRLAVLMYEASCISNRNLDMINKRAPGKFQ